MTKKIEKIFFRGALYIMCLLDAEFYTEYNGEISFNKILCFELKVCDFLLKLEFAKRSVLYTLRRPGNQHIFEIQRFATVFQKTP